MNRFFEKSFKEKYDASIFFSNNLENKSKNHKVKRFTFHIQSS